MHLHLLLQYHISTRLLQTVRFLKDDEVGKSVLRTASVTWRGQTSSVRLASSRVYTRISSTVIWQSFGRFLLKLEPKQCAEILVFFCGFGAALEFVSWASRLFYTTGIVISIFPPFVSLSFY